MVDVACDPGATAVVALAEIVNVPEELPIVTVTVAMPVAEA
jgi:hypothetical protein